MKNILKKIKNRFSKIVKRIDWKQSLINAIVIYIVCHLILKIF